jgi:DUF1680 family protein
MRLNGNAIDSQPGDNGYLTIERSWQVGDVVRLDLHMEPMFVAPHPRIDALRGCVALQRGPLMYCFESYDQPEEVDLQDVAVVTAGTLTETAVSIPDSTVAMQVSGQVLLSTWGESLYLPLDERPQIAVRPVQLNAIPYFLWGNRGMESMRIWVPQAE